MSKYLFKRDLSLTALTRQFMNQQHRKWSKLILLGAADLDADDIIKAISRYERAQILADRLIDETIVTFDGDMSPLTMYSDSCKGLVQAHQRAGDSAAAHLCLEQTAERLLAVMKNPSYPLLMRGKMIRAFEPLFGMKIQIHQAEDRLEDALGWIRDWLAKIQQQVARTRPVQEMVMMN